MRSINVDEQRRTIVPKSTFDLNRYLKIRDLNVNMIKYHTTPTEQLKEGAPLTLFSKNTSTRITQDMRFEMYDQYGQRYVENMKKEMFEHKAPRLLKSKLVPIEDDERFKEGIIELILQLVDRDLFVLGRKISRYETWKIDNVEALKKEMQPTDEELAFDINPVNLFVGRDSDDQGIVLYDEEDVQVMHQNKRAIFRDEGVKVVYDICCDDSTPVITNISFEQLGWVLFALLFDVEIDQINALFLRPVAIAEDTLAESELLYDRYKTSDAHLIQSLEDIEKIPTLVLNEALPYTGTYSLWDDRRLYRMTHPIASKDVFRVLEELSDNKIRPSTLQDERFLTDALIILAADYYYGIQRTDRVFNKIYDTSDFVYDYHRITNFSMTPRQDNEIHLPETFFDIIDTRSDYRIMSDLSFEELAPAMMQVIISMTE